MYRWPIFKISGPRTNLGRDGKEYSGCGGGVERMNITSLVDLLWVTSYSSFIYICSVHGH